MGIPARRLLSGRLFLLLALTGACVTGPAKQQMPSLWAGLKAGADRVGHRMDDSISIWYPAADGGELMRYRDYFDSLDDAEKEMHAKKMSDQQITDLFDTKMYANHNAPALGGPRSLVVIEQQKGQAAADHAVLAEFLASHGYVVASVPTSVSTAKLKAQFTSAEVDSAEWLHGIDFSAAGATKLLELLERHRTR